jgi:hypothetical protein
MTLHTDIVMKCPKCGNTHCVKAGYNTTSPAANAKPANANSPKPQTNRHKRVLPSTSISWAIHACHWVHVKSSVLHCLYRVKTFALKTYENSPRKVKL